MGRQSDLGNHIFDELVRTLNQSNITQIGYMFDGMYEFISFCELTKDSLKTDRVYSLKGLDYIATFLQGYNHYLNKEYSDAINYFTDSLNYNPVGIKARLHRADCLIKTHKFEQANLELMMMSKIIHSDKDKATYYRLFGTLEFEKTNYYIAVACYAYSRSLDSKNLIAYETLNELECICMNECRFNESLNSFKEIIQGADIPFI